MENLYLLCLDTTVAFRVSRIYEVDINGTAKFSIVQLNEGGGYNNSTGIFTAHSPGVYSFTVTLCMDIAQQAWFMINYLSPDGNTTSLAAAVEKDMSSTVCPSIHGITRLSVGSEVYVWSKFSKDGMFQDENHMCIFTGIKIAA